MLLDWQTMELIARLRSQLLVSVRDDDVGADGAVAGLFPKSTAQQLPYRWFL